MLGGPPGILAHMSRVGLITYSKLPHGPVDDQPLAAALRDLGVTADWLVWDAPHTDLSRYDLLVLRSPWDYHHRPAEFRTWLDAVSAQGLPLLNPAATVRWNMDKRYLRDLQQQGIAIAPTRFFAAHAAIDLPAVLAEEGWGQVVIKPSVSASAHATWRTTGDGFDGQRLADMQANLPAEAAILVQPYLPEITAGEWSLVFIARQFSHAVRKIPPAGDFRVQEEHGGTTQPADAPAALVSAAAQVLAAVPGDLLYARVDGLWRDNHLLLMELEVFEPSLYLKHSAGAAERFASAIAARLARSPDAG